MESRVMLVLLFFILTINSINALTCGGGTCNALNYCATCGVNTYAGEGTSCNLDDDCESCPGTTTSSKEGAYQCTDSATQNCPAGSGEVSGYTGCYECDAGTYNDGTQLTCQTCSEGYYSSSGAYTCSQCSEGQYNTVDGSSSCSTCSMGQTSNTDHTGCVDCSAGTYNGGYSGVCSDCPTGAYSTVSGATTCTACGEGSTSNTGNTGCTQCAAGTYNSENEGTCSDCSDGYYSAAGASECTTCGGGYVSINSNTGCEYCPAGTRISNNQCVDCPAGQTSPAGETYCYDCAPGTYSVAGGTCQQCSPTTYNYYEGSTTCYQCPQGECSSPYDGIDCGQCILNGLTASAFSAIIILTLLFASCSYVTFEWNKVVILACCARALGKSKSTNGSDKKNEVKDVAESPMAPKSASKNANKASAAQPTLEEVKPQAIEQANVMIIQPGLNLPPMAIVDEPASPSAAPIAIDAVSSTIEDVEEGVIVVNQPKGFTKAKSAAVNETFEIKRQESTNGYQSVIAAQKKHIFDIPIYKVSPHIYGLVNLANQMISFVSFIVSIATSSTFSELEVQIVFIMILHVIVSWVVVPIWQTLSIHDSEGADVSCEKKGCFYCNCCGICCSLMARRSKFVSRKDDGCRYIPFSLYNLIFMVRNPGMQLNNKLSDTLPCFGFGRIYMLLMSMNTKGTLNLYIFVNALNKVFYNAASEGSPNISTISAVVSMVFAFTDLKVYAFTTVFGLLLLPFTASMSMMFCFRDCCGAIDRLSAKNGTWEFRLFMKFWSYVDKY